jgi:hypothetical protein
MPFKDPGKPARRFFEEPEMVPPGEYAVTVETAGKMLIKKAVIKGRQGWTFGPGPSEIR